MRPAWRPMLAEFVRWQPWEMDLLTPAEYERGRRYAAERLKKEHPDG